MYTYPSVYRISYGSPGVVEPAPAVERKCNTRLLLYLYPVATTSTPEGSVAFNTMWTPPGASAKCSLIKSFGYPPGETFN